jgi:hypothetical protein
VYIEFSYPEFISDGRDRSVIRFYLPPKTGQPDDHDLRYRTHHNAVHVAVLWGPDRSQKVVAVLAALYLRNREMLEQLVAVRHERGRLDFWYRDLADVKDVQRALEDAIEAVLWQRGAWKVNAGQVVACKGNVVDWQAMPEDHPLRSTAKGQGLGLIAAHGVP